MRLASFPSGTQAHYEALAGELIGAEIPPERRVFLAGPTEVGWQVVKVWDDRKSLERFNERWLLPALARLGDRGFPHPPVVTDFGATTAEIQWG